MNTPHQEMSIIGDTRSAKEITAEVLKESLEQKKTERQMGELRKKFSIVQQIIDVRYSLEQYEMGGIREYITADSPCVTNSAQLEMQLSRHVATVISVVAARLRMTRTRRKSPRPPRGFTRPARKKCGGSRVSLLVRKAVL